MNTYLGIFFLDVLVRFQGRGSQSRKSGHLDGLHWLLDHTRSHGVDIPIETIGQGSHDLLERTGLVNGERKELRV